LLGGALEPERRFGIVGGPLPSAYMTPSRYCAAASPACASGRQTWIALE
jgi:hypothetical protein